MSYATALPVMASWLSARVPAAVMPPWPLVEIQFICLLGPSCSTLPPEVAYSHMWLSAR